MQASDQLLRNILFELGSSFNQNLKIFGDVFWNVTIWLIHLDIYNHTCIKLENHGSSRPRNTARPKKRRILGKWHDLQNKIVLRNQFSRAAKQLFHIIFTNYPFNSKFQGQYVLKISCIKRCAVVAYFDPWYFRFYHLFSLYGGY